MAVEQDSPTGERFCVFRSDEAWFACPAMSVREVANRPPLVRVPCSPPQLAGLAHLRNEFVPVFSMSAIQDVDNADERQLLLMGSSQTPWALLVDAVVGLESLEVSATTGAPHEAGWTAALIGWAGCRETVVRVIDADRLYRRIQHELAAGWEAAQWPAPQSIGCEFPAEADGRLLSASPGATS